MYNQYQTPPDYSIPSPYGPRQHNWAGGFLDEGSQYHGPNYYRPSYKMPWKMRPLNGLTSEEIKEDSIVSSFMAAVMIVYPELGEEFLKDASKSDEKNVRPLRKKLANCIRQHSSIFSLDIPITPDLDVEEIEQLFSREDVEKILECSRSEGLKLAYVVPAVAVLGVLAWFVFKKKGRK